jgi:EAL domain-containing protein (putative c-di-GMP-specific phosphodiesterase class I)
MTPAVATQPAQRGWGPRATRFRVRRAMPRGELALYAQPTVDCISGQVVGAEALIRWRHPRRGLLMPGEWLPAVETGAMSPPFNLHVLELALEHRENWERREGFSLPLSVNVTPDCFTDPRFVDGVEALFGDRSPVGAIRLEVTERATVAGPGSLDTSIDRLRRLGFEFHLDDFGADHSSLSRLATLPFTTLKLDRSLVAPMVRRHSHRLIVAAAIQMSHALGLTVVAEGVEDVPTWSLLQALGSDLIQGFVVARPLPAEELPAFARSHVADPPQSERLMPWRPRSGDRRRLDDRRLEAHPVAPSGQERRTGEDRRRQGEQRLAPWA